MRMHRVLEGERVVPMLRQPCRRSIGDAPVDLGAVATGLLQDQAETLEVDQPGERSQAGRQLFSVLRLRNFLVLSQMHVD